MIETKLSEIIHIILKEILFFFYRFPFYPQAIIKLFTFDLVESKQDFANIHVSLSEIGQNTLGSPGILKLIV